MATFAVACLRNIVPGPAIVQYLERIDATLEPFNGRFRIHGGPVERLEGHWSGDLIAIEFPDRQRARAWYHSAAYQAILALRTAHSEGDVIFIEGVSDLHRATDVLRPGLSTADSTAG
jgi:uncharacterized protein (DUF1330 family)